MTANRRNCQAFLKRTDATVRNFEDESVRTVPPKLFRTYQGGTGFDCGTEIDRFGRNKMQTHRLIRFIKKVGYKNKNNSDDPAPKSPTTNLNALIARTWRRQPAPVTSRPSPSPQLFQVALFLRDCDPILLLAGPGISYE